MKHTSLPIPDLDVDAEIDAERRRVTIRLQDHIDSALLIRFCRDILEPAGVRVVDNVSHNALCLSQVEGRYELDIHVFGQVLEAQVAQLTSHDKPVRDTLCLRPKAKERGARRPGALAGRMRIADDFDESSAAANTTLEQKLAIYDPDKHSGETC